MPAGNPEILAYLQSLRSSPLRIVESSVIHYAPGFLVAVRSVPSSRLILLAQGKLRYTVADRTLELHPGQLIFIPSGTARGWSADPKLGCTLEWFAYECDTSAPPPPALIRTTSDLEFERTALARIASAAMHDPLTPILQELEAKAALVRFLACAEPLDHGRLQPDTRALRAVKQAACYLADHLAADDPLTGLPERVGLSPAHFRRVFRATFKTSAGHYLLSLRMRKAREQLAGSTLAVKEIAKQLGYSDPLYFARQYRRFWGHAPSRTPAGHA